MNDISNIKSTDGKTVVPVVFSADHNFKMPLFSVCVPVYNVEKYIERLARSLFEQTFEDIEFIFVDDCSPDNSIEVLNNIIKDYPKRRVQVLRLEKNSGPHEARMKAFNQASGEYIFFADADDWVETNMFEILYKEVNSAHPEIINFSVYIDANGNSDIFKAEMPKNFNQWFSKAVSGKACIALWSYVVNRRILKNAMYRQEFRLTRFEDYYLLIRIMAFSSNTSVISVPLYHHDVSNDNSLTKKTDIKSIESIVYIAGEIERFLQKEKLYDDNISSISKIKHYSKNLYIIVPDCWNPNLWRQIWPDIHKSVKDSLVHNMFFWLVSNKLDKLAKIFLKIKNRL